LPPLLYKLYHSVFVTSLRVSRGDGAVLVFGKGERAMRGWWGLLVGAVLMRGGGVGRLGNRRTRYEKVEIID
jgi:hypothetical protein